MPDHYPDKTNNGISASKLMGRPVGANASLIIGNQKAIAINARKITLLKNITKEQQNQDAGDTVGDKLPGGGGGLLKTLQSISDNMESIKNTILNQQKFDTKSAEDDRKEKEKAARSKKEKDLEGKFQGLKTVASKVLAPIKSMWERLLDFVTTIFLGRVAIKLFEWFSDKENQDKIKAIGRFIKDFWPALLAGYLLFGNALSKFIIGLGAALVKWGGTLLLKVIPALGKALAKMKLASMGPLGWAALGTTAVVGGAAYIGSRRNERLREESNQQDDTSTVTPTEFTESRQDDDPSNDETPSGAQLMNETVQQRGLGMMFNKGGFVQPSDPIIKPVQKFAEGGSVPGSGPNTDTVPAMLTPGEFVMSRGAVQRYGVDTLEGMNAAAGGTNRPKLPGLGGGGGIDSLTGGDFFSGDIDLEMSQRMAGGGEVKQLGTSAAKRIKMKSLESKKTYLIEVLKESKEKIAQSEKSIAKSNPKVNVPKAPEKKKSTIAYEEQKALAQQSQQNGQSPVRQDLPSIDAGAMISLSKIKTLGISV